MDKTNSKNNNSILIFEYYTASGTSNSEIIPEAIAMVNCLLDDLKDLTDSDNLNINFLVSKEFEYIGEEYSYINTIVLDEKINLESWLQENITNFNSCMFISAEENMNLYKLTNLIESQGVKIYGSNSEATLLCSDKFETYRRLKYRVNQPRTFKITLNDQSDWEVSLENILKFLEPFVENSSDSSKENNSNNDQNETQNDFKLIAKPIFGVDCQNMAIISDSSEITKLKNIYPEDSEILVQEFVQGESFSVSLISDGDVVIPLSLNKQYTEITKENHSYNGGELPCDHPLKEMAFNLAKTAVEELEGVKGFVGVDLILDNENGLIYLLEINSRFTTSYVGLSKIAKFNIPKTIIDVLDNKVAISSIIKDIGFENTVKFAKNGNKLDIEIL